MLRFVLVRGVLSYGATMFVVMMLVNFRSDEGPRVLAVSAMLSLLGGAAFGVLTWILMEWVYRKFSRGIPL